MKIRKYFAFYNLITLVLPVILIAVISFIFLIAFIVRFPIEELYIARTELINPMNLVRALGVFFNNHPSAIIYFIIWIAICLIIISLTTTIVNRIMSLKIEKSINGLKKAVDNVRQGNLSFEILGCDVDEINRLCMGFDDMKKSLLASQQREELLKKERSMLIANISHDLKTPITAIRGYIDGINDGIADTPEKLSAYLGTIKSKTKTIETLVNNLSMFSRLSLTSLEFNYHIGELSDLLYALADDYRLILSQNSIELITDITADDTTVMIDYEKIMRVFVNIIENSIKYKRTESKELVIKCFTQNNGVYVHIIDDGMGIEQSELENVFMSFYRVDEARTSNIKGNGLGLGIAKEIVEQHKGRIWLKSDGINKGTTAIVYLPMYKEKGMVHYTKNINS